MGKSNNERILYSIDVITSALLNKKQVSFLYYDVCEEKQSITKKKEYDNFDLNAYRKESFSMFSGEKVEVTLFFPRDLIYVAKERFGDIIPVSVDSGYIIHTTVRVSKTFFAWLSTFEGQVKIIEPKSIRQQFKEFISGILAKIE